MGSVWCPRCGADLVPPSAFSSAWRCPDHGQVLPLTALRRRDSAAVSHIRDRARVPLWLPDPSPVGWTLSGLAGVGDERSGFRAAVSAHRGPAPLGGVGEWLIVAEEPGIGLGAGYAGSDLTSLPDESADAIPAKIHAGNHPTALWPVSGVDDGRSAYVGEADGVWLWLISYPADAGYAVLEDLSIVDVRTQRVPELVAGEPSDRLRPAR